MLPARSCEIVWHLQHSGITKTASTHARPVEDHPSFQETNLPKAKTAKCWQPQEFPQVQVGSGKVLISEPFAALQYQYTVALLSQAHGGNASAEARPNDHIIKGLLNLFTHVGHTSKRAVQREFPSRATQLADKPLRLYDPIGDISPDHHRIDGLETSEFLQRCQSFAECVTCV